MRNAQFITMLLANARINDLTFVVLLRSTSEVLPYEICLRSLSSLTEMISG